MMKKIAELNNVTSIPEFYNGMMLIYRNKNFLFEETYEIVHEIYVENWHPLEVSNGKLFMYNKDLFVYDDKIKKFVLCQSSIEGGAVAFGKSSTRRPRMPVEVDPFGQKMTVPLYQNKSTLSKCKPAGNFLVISIPVPSDGLKPKLQGKHSLLLTYVTP